MKEFLIENYMYFIAIAIIAFGLIWIAVKRPQQIKEWLISACAEAELYFGSGTGQLKLREVYDVFIHRFPIIAFIISFDTFSGWVDTALDELKTLIDENPKLNEFFNPSGPDESVDEDRNDSDSNKTIING